MCRDQYLTPKIPDNCPLLLHELMQMCWKKEPDQRPVSFILLPPSSLSQTIREMNQIEIQSLTCCISHSLSKKSVDYWNVKQQRKLSFLISQFRFGHLIQINSIFFIVILIWNWLKNKQKIKGFDVLSGFSV
jgi:hypothetical protein